jgi:NADH-quinone oxidoreductase subunit J
MIQQAVFLGLAAITLGGALGVVTARSVFVAALWLILSFVGVAGMYVLLEAGFLAVIQVLIYVGAISVLILFAVMLTRDVMRPDGLTNDQWPLATILSLSVFAALLVLGFRADWPLRPGLTVPGAGVVVTAGEPDAVAVDEIGGAFPDPTDPEGERYIVPGPVAHLGRSFVTEHLLAFEVVSAILLVALVGAIVIARE